MINTQARWCLGKSENSVYGCMYFILKGGRQLLVTSCGTRAAASVGCEMCVNLIYGHSTAPFPLGELSDA